MPGNPPSEWAIEKAVQQWCHDDVANREMDASLASHIAAELDNARAAGFAAGIEAAATAVNKRAAIWTSPTYTSDEIAAAHEYETRLCAIAIRALAPAAVAKEPK